MGVNDSMVQEDFSREVGDDVGSPDHGRASDNDEGGIGGNKGGHAGISADDGTAGAVAQAGVEGESSSAFLPLENVPYTWQNPSTARLSEISSTLMGLGASSLYLSRIDELKSLLTA